MTPREIDEHIMKCPYFGGKHTIDRTIVNGETTHIGNCRLEWHDRSICPSGVCFCAETFGLREKR